MRRIVAPALLCLIAGACAHVTDEDRQVITVYLENAAQYYDAGHYLRAYQQWGRVLELDDGEERARLGQGMALYQLGREESADGVARLAAAEDALGKLRNGEIAASWKADLGFGLVQLRWAELYARKTRKFEADLKEGREVDAAEVALCRAEVPKRVSAAESSFRSVLENPETEPNFHLTCWLGLARSAAARGDWAATVDWARRYEKKVVESKTFWSKQGQEYATRLLGAELQEVELRDTMANCLYKLGRHDEAESELDRIVQIAPNRAAAYLNRAQLRKQRGAWDLARSDFRQFLARSDLPKDSPARLDAEKLLVECEDALAAEDELLRRGQRP